jgi:hypothetical protein
VLALAVGVRDELEGEPEGVGFTEEAVGVAFTVVRDGTLSRTRAASRYLIATRRPVTSWTAATTRPVIPWPSSPSSV